MNLFLIGQKVKYKTALPLKLVNILLMLCCMVLNILGSMGFYLTCFGALELRGSVKKNIFNEIGFEKRGIS